MSRVPPSSVLKSQVGVASGSDSISLARKKIGIDRVGLVDRSNAKTRVGVNTF